MSNVCKYCTEYFIKTAVVILIMGTVVTLLVYNEMQKDYTVLSLYQEHRHLQVRQIEKRYPIYAYVY